MNDARAVPDEGTAIFYGHFHTTMSEPVATPAGGFDANDAFDQALGDSSPAAVIAPEVDAPGEEKDTSKPQTDGENKDGGAEKADQKPKEGATTKPDEGEEKPTEEEGKPGTFKVGNREFSKVEDAVAEANRIAGRNAKLSGDLKTATEATEKAQKEADGLKAQIADLRAANKAWEDWSKDQGERPAIKETDAGDIADQVIAKLSKRDTEKAEKDAAQKELEAVEAAANYDDVSELVEKLSDKINPLTDKHFTPTEAYRYACRELGLENLVEKKAEPTPKAEEKPPETKIAKPPVKAAAARPTGAAPTAPPKKDARDAVDEMLDEALR